MYGEQLFSIGGFGPTLYGIMFAIGICCCLFMLNVLGKKVGMAKSSIEFFEMSGIVAILVGVLTSMIFQWIYNLIQYGKSEFGSMTFIGGLIGGVVSFILGTIIFGKPQVKKDFFRLAQIAVPCILIAHAFGRVGCFFAGCCYGRPTDSFIGIVFPYGGSVGKVIPTQLIEAIFLFIMCGLTVLMILKEKPYNLATYAIGYSIFRFIIEFLRDDDRGSFMPGISPSQFWSIIIFLIGVGVLTIQILYRYKKDKFPKWLAWLASGINNSAIITERPDEPLIADKKVKVAAGNAAPAAPEIKKDGNDTVQEDKTPPPEKKKKQSDFTDGFDD